MPSAPTLTAIQLACVLAALVGLAFLAGWPWALAAGGVVGAVACEAIERRRRADETADARRRPGRDANGDRL